MRGCVYTIYKGLNWHSECYAVDLPEGWGRVGGVADKAALDEVLKEAMWAMEWVQLREYQNEVVATEVDPHSEEVRELLRGDTAYKRAQAFLDKYRTRQGGEDHHDN